MSVSSPFLRFAGGNNVLVCRYVSSDGPGAHMAYIFCTSDIALTIHRPVRLKNILAHIYLPDDLKNETV